MKKIIFCDIDGVLFTNNHYKLLCEKNKGTRDRFGFLYDPDCVNYLNEITDKTDAKIVISSSWRMSGLKVMKECFKHRGITGNVIDCTPIGTIDKLFLTRGHEIDEWLSNNEVEKYVIIDDNNVGQKYEKSEMFFKTNMSNGITENIKNNIIKYLNE